LLPLVVSGWASRALKRELRGEVDGMYRQELASGRIVDRPSEETRVLGRMHGRPVRCASVAIQVRERQRLEAGDNDRRRLAALRPRFQTELSF